jgi:hypothetical protein
MMSRKTYILLGACGGLGFGLFALLRPGMATVGVVGSGICMAGGGILGAVMHATQHWDAHGPAGNLLRWICGLALAGLVLGLIVASLRLIPFAGVPAAVALGLMSGLGFGLKFQYRPLFSEDEGPKRTDFDVENLWGVILATIALSVVLFTTTWALTK